MDKMREEFEAWFSAENGALPQKASDGGYYYTPANDMWIAWQASRAALHVELPGAWILAEHEYKRQVEESLDSAGVSYE